jgi:hypothetical protein
MSHIKDYDSRAATPNRAWTATLARNLTNKKGLLATQSRDCISLYHRQIGGFWMDGSALWPVSRDWRSRKFPCVGRLGGKPRLA